MRHFEYYCNEDIRLVENYEKAKADDFNGWDCHHRLETHNFDGTKRKRDLSIEDLMALDMYLYRPASELIFMRAHDHMSLHRKGKNSPNKGRIMSEETRKKISEASKGRCHTKETKRKMSEAAKGRIISEETKRKMSEAHKGNPGHWLGKHRSEETKRKITEAKKGLHWFTNGVENRYCRECPEGFVLGRK